MGVAEEIVAYERRRLVRCALGRRWEEALSTDAHGSLGAGVATVQKLCSADRCCVGMILRQDPALVGRAQPGSRLRTAAERTRRPADPRRDGRTARRGEG